MSYRLSYAYSRQNPSPPLTRKPYALHAMSIAGPEDEQPGDEVEGVHYFDFTDPLGSGKPATDPFEAEDLPESRGTAGASKAPGRPRAEGEPADEPPLVDPFEYALTGGLPALPAPRQEAVTPETEPSAEPPENAEFFELASLFESGEADPGSRERFALVFDAARTEHGPPFLAIALRMPAGTPTSAHFPVVVEGIRAALGGSDVVLADEDRLRLVAVFRGRRAEDARALFTQLKDYLRERTAEPDAVLRAISALVAPDGRPFRDAAEFLARAYDEG